MDDFIPTALTKRESNPCLNSTTTSADAAAVIARFKKIQSLCAWLSILPIVLGMAIMGMLIGVHGKCEPLVGEFLGVPYYRWTLVGFGSSVFGLVFGIIFFRCPVCKAIPISNDGWLDDRGVVLNPDFCPSCKMRLR